jgi:hypothetical protein
MQRKQHRREEQEPLLPVTGQLNNSPHSKKEQQRLPKR